MNIKIGKKAYIRAGKLFDDYVGRTGTIEMCRTCCNENRVQFDDIGNNEALSSFDILKCKINEGSN